MEDNTPQAGPELEPRLQRVEHRVEALESQTADIAETLGEVKDAHMETNRLLRDQLQWHQEIYKIQVNQEHREVQQQQENRERWHESMKAFGAAAWGELKDPIKYLVFLVVIWIGIVFLGLDVPMVTP